MPKRTNLKKEFDASSIMENKQKALKTAIEQIERNFGKGAIMLLGSSSSLDIESISTGSLSLDIALGIGGVPRGRITEIYGPESSGKTTVALSIAAQAQKNGGTVAFIDVEHALDPNYAKVLGVNIDSLLVSQPNSGEQALEIIETLVRSGAIDVVILDSVAAMTTKAEIEGEMGDANIGLQARLMSQAMRKLTGIISKTNCAAIFINQIREKIGIVYGNPETTPGGRALKFYSSVRMEIRRGEQIKDGTKIIGNKTKCKISKNKVAPPFKEAQFTLIYGVGISYISEIIDLAVNLNIINKSGSWFSYKQERIGQGRENVKAYLENNPEICNEIENSVRENIKKLNLMNANEKNNQLINKNESNPNQNNLDITNMEDLDESLSDSTQASDLDIFVDESDFEED